MHWILPAVLFLAFIASITILNIHYRKERAKLTPEQRKSEDEALKNEGIIY